MTVSAVIRDRVHDSIVLWEKHLDRLIQDAVKFRTINSHIFTTISKDTSKIVDIGDYFPDPQARKIMESFQRQIIEAQQVLDTLRTDYGTIKR